MVLLVWEVTDFFRFAIVVDRVLFSSRVVILVGAGSGQVCMVCIFKSFFVDRGFKLMEYGIVSVNDFV